MKYTEQRIKHCFTCKRKGMHYRNNSRMGAGGVIVNLVLVILTGGLWLIPLVLFLILSVKFGGWKCGRCEVGE